MGRENRRAATMARSITENLAYSSPGVSSAESVAAEDSGRASEELRRLKGHLHRQLVMNMDLTALASMNKDQLHLEVRRVADELCQRSATLINRQERERLVNEVLDETFGLGPLEPLMKDPSITDILINGHQTVYVEREGRLER